MMDQPHVDICKLAKGTKLIVETEASLWSFEVLDPEKNLVLAFAQNGMFKKPMVGCLAYSFQRKNKPEAPDFIVIGWRFILQFSDISLMSERVLSVLVEGKDEKGKPWKYEV